MTTEEKLVNPRIATIEDVRRAARVLRQHISPAPLIRSYALEQELKLPASRRVWLKDYGWTPVGSFKLMGALNWMANNLERIGERPVAAHSSGNFASGISFAGMRYERRVIIVMPETAPKVKFELTRSFGAQIRTYDISTDHETGARDRLTPDLSSAKRSWPLPRAAAAGGVDRFHHFAYEGRLILFRHDVLAPVAGRACTSGLCFSPP